MNFTLIIIFTQKEKLTLIELSTMITDFNFFSVEKYNNKINIPFFSTKNPVGIFSFEMEN